MQYIGLIIAAVLVGIDRLTKWIVKQKMVYLQSISIIKIGDKEVLNLSYYLNDGAAFSKFGGRTTMLIIVTTIIIVTLILLLLLKKVKRPSYIIALSMIIGGGIGNLIDRIFNEGMVIDFIDFRLINFAIFNFADICAVCGAGIIMLMVVIDEARALKKKISAARAKRADKADIRHDREA